jgi:hypothetical protein
MGKENLEKENFFAKKKNKKKVQQQVRITYLFTCRIWL